MGWWGDPHRALGPAVSVAVCRNLRRQGTAQQWTISCYCAAGFHSEHFAFHILWKLSVNRLARWHGGWRRSHLWLARSNGLYCELLYVCIRVGWERKKAKIRAWKLPLQVLWAAGQHRLPKCEWRGRIGYCIERLRLSWDFQGVSFEKGHRRIRDERIQEMSCILTLKRNEPQASTSFGF